MPIAFKEWAVTVRALAEGEQLVTFRKGLRETSKGPRLEHDRSFLFPSFEQQRNDLVVGQNRPPSQFVRPLNGRGGVVLPDP